MTRCTVWQPLELQFRAEGRYENPYLEVDLTVTFRHESGVQYLIPGFWRGSAAFAARFAPTLPGRWTWGAEFGGRDPGLAGEGSFEAVPYQGSNGIRRHGFLKVAPGGRHLMHDDGTPFFWLADTVWSAGARATPEEWATYVAFRAGQGFNVAQINTLPQHDASRPEGRRPFDEDLDQMNPAYFAALDGLVATASEAGIIPALVALWFDYVPDTNATWGVPRKGPFSADQARRFGRYLAARYGAYGALWLVTGDTNFPAGESLSVYTACAQAIRTASTHPLCTAHMHGGLATPPLVDAKGWVDFHMYQSGHGTNAQTEAVRLAEVCRALEPGRPVLNGEPCYENHGHFNHLPRHSRLDARRAAWRSVLAGANAGITYGGHGLWSWHREGDEFRAAGFSAMCLPWEQALHYGGARDYGLLRRFFAERCFWALEPRQDLLSADADQVRAAELPLDRQVLVYAPDCRDLLLDAGRLPAAATFTWLNTVTGEQRPARTHPRSEGLRVDSPLWDEQDGLLVIRR